MARKTKSLIDRFNEKHEAVTESGCWIWMAHVMRNGYGQFWDGRIVDCAHRVSYRLFVGPIDRMHVLHKCDNSYCVNPDHLFLGTQNDNMKDMASKDRRKGVWAVRGSDAHPSKLCADQVVEIRRSYAAGEGTQRSIAARFGVSQPAIKCIVKRQVWKHI